MNIYQPVLALVIQMFKSHSAILAAKTFIPEHLQCAVLSALSQENVNRMR